MTLSDLERWNVRRPCIERFQIGAVDRGAQLCPQIPRTSPVIHRDQQHHVYRENSLFRSMSPTDLERPHLVATLTYVGRGVCLGGQPYPHPKSQGPASPNCWNLLHGRTRHAKQQRHFARQSNSMCGHRAPALLTGDTR